MNKEQLAGLFARQTVAQRYNLDQYAQEELVGIYLALNKAQSNILGKWNIATEWSQLRALGLLEEAKAIMDAIKPKMTDSLASLLGHVSASSSKAYSDILSFGGQARGIVPALLSAEQMRAFWRETPVGGQLLREWVDKTFSGPTVNAIQRQVFAGMFEGMGFPEMRRALRDGIAMSKREAETLVHTYVQSANVHAMETVYKKNRDVVVGVRWLAAFDKRTCLRCAVLCGKLYPLDNHPPCPCHPRCRCVLIPETDFRKLRVRPQVAKDWAKGIKTPMPDALATVLTPDGIPKNDFRRWILAQSDRDQSAFFGPSRYAMLKARQIGWDDLVDTNALRIRTLAELRGDMSLVANAKLGDAEAAAQLASKLQNKLVQRALNDAALTSAVDAAATAKAAEKEAKKAAEAAKKKHGEAVKAGIAKKKAAIERIVHKKAKGERLTAEEAKLAQGLSAGQKAAMRRAVQEEIARLEGMKRRANPRVAGPGEMKSRPRPEPRLTPEEKAVLAQIEDPREVVTFTKDGPVPPQYNKPVDKPDLGQKEIWAPELKSKGGKPISTGAIVIDEATGKVFLVKPKGGFGGYEHTFPKGKLAKGLSPQQNAIKEVWEESGLDVELVDYLGGYEKTTSTTHYFVARLKGGSPAGFLDETEAVVLAPMDKLKGLVNTAVDKKVADDFLKSLAKARDINPDDLTEGFKTLNWRRKMKQVDVANAKKTAAKIKNVKEWMESGAPDAPKKLGSVMLALDAYSGGPKLMKKLEKVAQNLLTMTAAKKKAAQEAKKAAAKALKEAEKAAKRAAKEAAEKAAKEAAEKAAKAEAEKTLDGRNLVWSRAKEGGSNKAAYYKDKNTGVEYYVKFLGDDAKIDNEILASKLYAEAGVNVPELKAVIMPGGERALASRVVPGVVKNEAELVKAGSAMNKAAKRDMGVDAWLANWDVVGLEYDNLVIDAAGKVYHIDVGGSLLYRAQGVAKGTAFDKTVTELETFFTKNAKAGEVFADITEEEIVGAVRRIAAIPETRIRELVASYGPGDAKLKKSLADKLVARRKYLMDKYKIAEPKPDSAKVRYGPADEHFAADVNRLGAQGKSLPTDKDMIEDQNVQVFVQNITDKDGNIVDRQTVIRMKLRPGAGNDDFISTFEGLTEDKAEALGLLKRGGYRHGKIECTRRTTRAGECYVVQENVPLHQMYTIMHQAGMKGKKGFQYSLKYKDKTTVRYIPFSSSNDGLYAFQGELDITIPGRATAESINGALEKLLSFGIDTSPATAANAEKMYLDKLAYIRKIHVDKTIHGGKTWAGQWSDMVAKTAGAPVETQIAERKRLLSRHIGVDDVSELPDYNPDGEYQLGVLSGRRDAGQRLQLRPDITQEMLDREMEHYYIVHKLTSDGDPVESLRAIFRGNMVMASNVDKIRHGIPAGGMSPVADAGTGGSQYFFARIANMESAGWQGDVADGRVVFKKDLLRRMDSVSHDHDAYGKSYGDYITNHRFNDIDGFKRCALEPTNETDLKQAVTLLDNVEVITLRYQHQVDEAVKMFAALGIDTLPDGRAIKDVIVVGKEWLKKKGYKS